MSASRHSKLVRLDQAVTDLRTMTARVPRDSFPAKKVWLQVAPAPGILGLVHKTIAITRLVGVAKAVD
ncbi:MAG: hypothetical protein WCE61_22140 [Candidatus Acidiferrum sp.]